MFLQVPELFPEEAKKLMEEEEVLLLDVRTPPEHAEERIPNSLLIPLDELRFSYDKLPKDKKIIVYCRSGERSAFATHLLRQLGYEAYNLAGGIIMWPYEKEGLSAG